MLTESEGFKQGSKVTDFTKIVWLLDDKWTVVRRQGLPLEAGVEFKK
jgi:hypothetical protein